MSIAGKLTSINEEKQAQRVAFTAKGVDMTGVPFTRYHEKIAEITGGEPSIPETPNVGPLDPCIEYRNTRPADWLPMPTEEQINDDEFFLLTHVPDALSSLIAFAVTCTGNYSVELGIMQQGTFVAQSSRSLASGQTYEDELFAAEFVNLTETGMKQCMIRVTGNAVTSFAPSIHSMTPIANHLASGGIVEFAGKLPSVNTLLFGGGSNQSLQNLKYVSLYGKNNISNMNALFYCCHSLTSISQLDTGAVTDMSAMFRECTSLTAIPQLDTRSVTTMRGMFNGCRSLATIPQLDTGAVTDMSDMIRECDSLITIPQLDTHSVTNMRYLFNGCVSLAEIPQFDTGAVKDMCNMFSGCHSLTKIPQLDTGAVTDMSDMFYHCRSLVEIPQLDTGAVTDMSAMFYSCHSLFTIPQLNTGAVTTMSSMFNGCRSLTEIPQLDTGAVTTMSSMFYGCRSLAAITLSSGSSWPGVDISFSNASLSRQAIVNLFGYLPTITTGKTITLTGNPGAADLTAVDIAIAGDKGWKIVK